jgi:hypothetical protein
VFLLAFRGYSENVYIMLEGVSCDVGARCVDYP